MTWFCTQTLCFNIGCRYIQYQPLMSNEEHIDVSPRASPYDWVLHTDQHTHEH
jgi:hypothetical protein